MNSGATTSSYTGSKLSSLLRRPRNCFSFFNLLPSPCIFSVGAYAPVANLGIFYCSRSDGPQPHKLTAYFVKRVGIRDIRFFVDYNEDESYTPTKIIFKSGTSENNLVEFATMSLDNPVGWQQVPITGAGGEPDGNTLISYVLQMQILENHQNGKDTHLRGIKIYALDADAVVQGPDFESRSQPLEGSDWASMADDVADAREAGGRIRGAAERDGLGAAARSLIAARVESGEAGFAIPDFMREPEIR